MDILPGIIAGMESRYETHNHFIDASTIQNIVDLPCGFEPRGLRYARKHMHYYGLDLPAVIERVSDAANSIMESENRKYLHYASVDATNYESLRKALTDVRGEILITTEGMLSYFTDIELKTVFQNIATLLEEFGGCWITFDRFSTQHASSCIQAVLGNVDESVRVNIAKVSSKLSDFTTKNNVLYASEDQEVLQLIEECGLTVEKIPFTKHSADLKAVKKLPEGTMERINGLLKEVELFLSGRLDSLSSPELLKEFQKLEEEQDVSSTVVHMENLEYISSAGLRTIQIIYEKTEGNFSITGCNDAVCDIVEKAGFIHR